MSKNLHFFAAMVHLADRLRLSALLTMKIELFYLHFKHTNTNNIYSGMAIYFALKTVTLLT